MFFPLNYKVINAVGARAACLYVVSLTPVCCQAETMRQSLVISSLALILFCAPSLSPIHLSVRKGGWSSTQTYIYLHYYNIFSFSDFHCNNLLWAAASLSLFSNTDVFNITHLFEELACFVFYICFVILNRPYYFPLLLQWHLHCKKKKSIYIFFDFKLWCYLLCLSNWSNVFELTK